MNFKVFFKQEDLLKASDEEALNVSGEDTIGHVILLVNVPDFLGGLLSRLASLSLIVLLFLAFFE